MSERKAEISRRDFLRMLIPGFEGKQDDVNMQRKSRIYYLLDDHALGDKTLGVIKNHNLKYLMGELSPFLVLEQLDKNRDPQTYDNHVSFLNPGIGTSKEKAIKHVETLRQIVSSGIGVCLTDGNNTVQAIDKVDNLPGLFTYVIPAAVSSGSIVTSALFGVESLVSLYKDKEEFSRYWLERRAVVRSSLLLLGNLIIPGTLLSRKSESISDLLADIDDIVQTTIRGNAIFYHSEKTIVIFRTDKISNDSLHCEEKISNLSSKVEEAQTLITAANGHARIKSEVDNEKVKTLRAKMQTYSKHLCSHTLKEVADSNKEDPILVLREYMELFAAPIIIADEAADLAINANSTVDSSQAILIDEIRKTLADKNLEDKYRKLLDAALQSFIYSTFFMIDKLQKAREDFTGKKEISLIKNVGLNPDPDAVIDFGKVTDSTFIYNYKYYIVGAVRHNGRYFPIYTTKQIKTKMVLFDGGISYRLFDSHGDPAPVSASRTKAN